MSSIYGECLKLSIFGQSHAEAVGMVLDGIPAGLSVDQTQLQMFLNRRAPGNHDYATARKEADTPKFLGGIVDSYTCGAPIAAIIENTNTHSGDYANLKDCPRPGHADYTAQIKYKGYQDSAGGGHFSGRLTAPLCIAGGMCIQWLQAMGVDIAARICSIDCIRDEGYLDPCAPRLEDIGKTFPVVDPCSGERMLAQIAAAKKAGDSVGGVIECFVTGLKPGLGAPMFGGMENKLSQILFGIPAVKGVEFGSGFESAYLSGSENNDAFYVKDGKILTKTNHAGGILGGITTGMPVIFRVAIKPTPSIALEQESVSLSQMKNTLLQVTGRHDPCIVPRAVPVVEAAAAIAIMDAYLIIPKESD